MSVLPFPFITRVVFPFRRFLCIFALKRDCSSNLTRLFAAFGKQLPIFVNEFPHALLVSVLVFEAMLLTALSHFMFMVASLVVRFSRM